jgi:hypothetical protein
MLYLSQAEVDDLCMPLSQPAAQVRYLRTLGLTVHTKPNGRPVVIRSHAETVLAGAQRGTAPPGESAPQALAPRPNRAALFDLFQGRKHGPTQKAQPT